ncbi:MAG: STM4014 family protein [Kofleriaceae bacterium]
MTRTTTSSRPFAVIGNPDHRRVTMFQAALAAQGCPPAHVIAWRDLAEPASCASALAGVPRDAIFRLDSTGEDAGVERALIERGEVAARAEGSPAISAPALARIPHELGRIIHPRQHHLGFVAILDELEAAVVARPDLRVVQSPAALRELFDKRVTSAKWRALGIPIPEALPGGPVTDPNDLRERMLVAGWPRVYVKLASGSSAACLAIFEQDRRGERLITTVEDTGDARYNTRKLQHLRARQPIDRVLRFLLHEGAQVERALAKARHADRWFDLRVLTIDGVPAFVVMRTSPHEITNLHLGGVRGDVAALQATIPEASWAAAMASCRRVQRESGAFHVGVDVMFEPGLETHRVLEGNAFGDLLPNLERDGTDVYGWQIRRLVSVPASAA